MKTQVAIWSERYPKPGLTNPESKTTTTLDEYMDTQIIGETFSIFWGLTQDWHLVPGKQPAGFAPGGFFICKARTLSGMFGPLQHPQHFGHGFFVTADIIIVPVAIRKFERDTPKVLLELPLNDEGIGEFTGRGQLVKST